MSIGISSGQIDSMLAMIRSTAAQVTPPSAAGLGNGNTLNSGVGNVGGVGGVSGVTSVGNVAGTAKVSFADALKNSLGQVNQIQAQAQQMGDSFAAGDDKVSLSDVMISTQKANISLQTTVQVRNKMVAAYNDIMNMQV